MAKYYQDFVGLNTFIYEPNGYDAENQESIGQTPYYESYDFGSLHVPLSLAQNQIGSVYISGELEGKPRVLQLFKNYRFPFDLSTTASFFPALMLHRNGPYGYPMWKQTRTSQNPLTRKQKKLNILTVTERPGPAFTSPANPANTILSRYGDTLVFVETPVVSKYHSITVNGGVISNPADIVGEAPVNGTVETVDDLGELSPVYERVKVRAPLGNSIVTFNNTGLLQELGIVNQFPEAYGNLKNMYLNGALQSDNSPLDVFETLEYKETVYPRLKQTYRNQTRQRTTFSFSWRDRREDRTNSFPEDLYGTDNNFGSMISQSMWPMDAATDFPTASLRSGLGYGFLYWGYIANSFPAQLWGDQGVLQNSYSSYSYYITNTASFAAIDRLMRVGPLYNRPHVLCHKSSSANINGMLIEGVNYEGAGWMEELDYYSIPSGHAMFEAASQSGKGPFYDSYGNFIQGPRQLGKDMSIIPEFRISDHVEFYESNSTIAENKNLFEITGGLANTTGSNEDNFYEVYSTTDFLKHFKLVAEDNEEMGAPIHLKMKCKGIKKLLPYDGFYPQQRTVQLASQFYKSYSGSLAMSGASDAWSATNPSQFGFQNIMAPMFAPGILFNSIKSGMAVDYPITDQILQISSSASYNPDAVGEFPASKVRVWHEYESATNQNYYLSVSGAFHGDTFDEYSFTYQGDSAPGLIFPKRIPFEALINPQMLEGITFHCMEPHEFANISASATFNPNDGDRLYYLMANNFFAESTKFFLKEKTHTRLVSKPSNEILGFDLGEEYAMRVKMYKTTNTPQILSNSGSNTTGLFPVPQHSTSSQENFTMYSRPTAFGPPSIMMANRVQYSSGSMNTPGGAPTHVGNRSDLGENYPFTPPYYHGEAWADIHFTPTSNGPVTIPEIIRQSKITYYRHVDSQTGTNIAGGVDSIFDVAETSGKEKGMGYFNNYVYNQNALQLSASISLTLSQRDLSGPQTEETSRWIIQSKWECPILNFNHLSSSTSITLPTNGSQSVPRGMWHQYGKLPQAQNEGVFLQITDIDGNWAENILGKKGLLSLADHIGFDKTPTRMGKVADLTEIFEAVVAVPFIETQGIRKFFALDRLDIRHASQNLEDRVGQSVYSMVQKMKKFVFPPSMDFLHDETMDPFAMYIFEFKHTLDQQDLADIWQGLYPKATEIMEEAESTISHDLLAKELLGGGSRVSITDNRVVIDDGAPGINLPPKVRWMVFKVKQRAATDYREAFDWTRDPTVETGGGASAPAPGGGSQPIDATLGSANIPRNTYNWPYDYFSLVELVKLDATVSIGKTSESSVREIVIPQGKIEEAAEAVSETLTPEAAESVRGGVATADLADIAYGPGGDYRLD